MVHLTVCLLAGRSHLIFRVLYVQYVWERGTLNGTLLLLLRPSLALYVEQGCPDIILGGTLARLVYLCSTTSDYGVSAYDSRRRLQP